MGRERIDRLCQSVLPREFERVKRELPRIQQFLERNLPDPAKDCVTLLTLNDDEIVIAASSPTVANYLRLHATEIRQQLLETLGLTQKVRFRAVPDALLDLQRQETRRQPRKVDAKALAALERGVQSIEDDDLRAAIESLAQSLEAD